MALEPTKCKRPSTPLWRVQGLPCGRASAARSQERQPRDPFHHRRWLGHQPAVQRRNRGADARHRGEQGGRAPIHLQRAAPETRRVRQGQPHYTNEWTLAEWSVSHATQSYHLYINGMEIPGVALDKGAGNFTRVELPKEFTSLSFGWNNYQAAGTGFVVWIDDIALGKDRIGPLAVPAP